MSKFYLILVIVCWAGIMTSCQEHQSPEFKPEYEQPNIQIKIEKPVRVKLRYNRGLA
jgi:hypothetical protein